jgi:hypothetical protein
MISEKRAFTTVYVLYPVTTQWMPKSICDGSRLTGTVGTRTVMVIETFEYNILQGAVLRVLTVCLSTVSVCMAVVEDRILEPPRIDGPCELISQCDCDCDTI